MSKVDLNIAGNTYTIGCDDGQEQSLLEIGRIINQKATEISAGTRVEEKLLLVMLNILFVDDLIKTKVKLEKTISSQDKKSIDEEKVRAVTDLVDNLTNKITNLASSIKVC